jgi:prepilin-type N-terminal cleavage/methylation domain-containing protein
MKQASRTPPRYSRRHGLTLIELIVVMVILVALAGMIVPLFPNLIGRAQSSAGATNLGEVSRAVQTYYNLYNNHYPNNLDSIVNASGVLVAYVPNGAYVPTGATNTAVDLVAYPLTSSDLSALAQVNITNVAQMVDQPTSASDWNPTFFPYGTSALAGPTYSTLASGSMVAALNPAAGTATRVFGMPTTGIGGGVQTPTYVVFGLGKYSSMSGTVMTDAPVRFSAASNSDPNTVYARLGLVFQTADSNGPLTLAKFVGTIQFSSTGVGSVGDNLQLNYSLK